MDLMELFQPQTLLCGRHYLKSEEKRTDYLFICYFHFCNVYIFFLTNPFLSNVTKFTFFTEPYLKQAVCQTVFEQSSCNGTLQKHIFASDRDTLTP